MFRSHPLFSVHCDGLQLFLYYDDVEVCNPLGSKRKIHKLGMYIYIPLVATWQKVLRASLIASIETLKSNL